MKMRVQVTITHDDATAFSDTVQTWENLDRDQVTYIESLFINVLTQLNALSVKDNADDGKGKKK